MGLCSAGRMGWEDGRGGGKKAQELSLHRIKSSEEVYGISLCSTPADFHTRCLRFCYSSPTCPPLTCEVQVLASNAQGPGERKTPAAAVGRPSLWMDLPGSRVVVLKQAQARNLSLRYAQVSKETYLYDKRGLFT